MSSGIEYFQGHPMTARQSRACKYLDKRGVIFGLNFGTQTAIITARQYRLALRGDEWSQWALADRGIQVNRA